MWELESWTLSQAIITQTTKNRYLPINPRPAESNPCWRASGWGIPEGGPGTPGGNDSVPGGQTLPPPAQGKAPYGGGAA